MIKLDTNRKIVRFEQHANTVQVIAKMMVLLTRILGSMTLMEHEPAAADRTIVPSTVFIAIDETVRSIRSNNSGVDTIVTVAPESTNQR